MLGLRSIVSGLFFTNEPSTAVIRVQRFLLGSRGLALAHLGGIGD
jgi:hypothetical protein